MSRRSAVLVPLVALAAWSGLSGVALADAGRSWRGALPPVELRRGFEAWLRDSLAAGIVSSTAAARDSGGLLPGPFFAPLDSVLLNGSARSGFSTTNLQEAGVDEADSIEFDGEFLYVAPPSGGVGPRPIRGLPIVGGPILGTPILVFPIAGAPSEPGEVKLGSGAVIRVLRTAERPAGAEEVAEIEVPGVASVSGLYLLGSAAQGDARLLVVGSAATRLEGSQPEPWDWGASRTTLDLFDVSDPTRPRAEWSLVIDGQLVSSRRIEETLHLVTRAVPVLRPVGEELDPALAERAAHWRLRRARRRELMPTLEIDGGVSQPLVSPQRCMLPLADAADLPSSPVLLTVTSLDLGNPRRRSSLCMGGTASQVYSSRDALYLTVAAGGDSVVHKFAYTERGPAYRGMGVVRGGPAGAQRGFSLGEHAGVLGVLTTHASASASRTYRLTLLRESPAGDLSLEEVAHLPNETEPEPIGKPGDFLHAVRFLGDRLYVVTYRKVDPLYVIDLADPAAPRIVGQLEVPGFSDYLHPISRDLLLGVGFDTAPDVRNDWFQGIKVELFDVSDPAHPTSLDAIAVGRRGSQSAALSEHHAIAHLPGAPDGVHRFALPIQVHDREPLPGDGPATHFPWLYTGLHLFEVEEASGGAAARLRDAGAVIAAEAAEGSGREGTPGDRSVIQGAAVHYVHGGRVWSAPWDAPEEAVGPH